MEKQLKIIREIQKAGFNVLNCGTCGNVFLAKIPADEHECPYCFFKSDISDFPDFIY